MKFNSYTAQELAEFVNSSEYSKLKNVPISKIRAISQANNPRASIEDKLLFVAFDEDKVVGYFGVLPDIIHFEDKQEKIGWGTCFWVDENYKSQNVAASLFLRVIRTWQQRLFFSNFAPWLGPVYQKTKIFQPIRYKVGIRAYLHFNLSDILPPKRIFFQRMVFLLKVADFMGNCFIAFRLKIKGRASQKGIKCEYVNEIDNQISEFVENHNKDEYMRLNKKEFEWICNYPWLVEGTSKDIKTSRYYFSTFSKQFFYLKVKFTNTDNKMVGFMILSVRNKNLTIPYFYSESEYNSEIVKFLFNLMKEIKIKMITVFNDKLIPAIASSKLPFLFRKEIKKPFLITMQLPYIEDLFFQDGDGDCVFT